MKCAVSANVGGTWFSKVCDDAATTYEAVCSIIKGNGIMFPDQNGTKSEYLSIVCSIFSGKTIGHEMFLMKLEKIDD